MAFWDILPDAFKKKAPKTLKFKKDIKKDSTMGTYWEQFKQTFSKAPTMRDAIKLKDGYSRDEWLAMNTIEAFNTLVLVYGYVSDFCTSASCPTMNAGEKYQYLWAESKKDKPQKLDAPTYTERLFEWIAARIDDPTIFVSDGNYPKKFMMTVKKIFTRMFRVYAHIYREHLTQLKEQEVKEHVDKCFKHLFYLIDEFQLVKEIEFVPVKGLIDQLKE
eukprot:TRINITY_DN14995_c0_g1_i1.p1 TRINITY_DN14995_c0_g1~~TRINITY_DN14995_c0_g1_i1.p1  ORF type:complete len:218 (+),score=34.17 TRINITY_DN14995_c0_g1_i1:15-668(+)